MISVIEINHCNRPRENNSIKMPLESKRQSASQRLMIVFIVGWIVFGFILSSFWAPIILGAPIWGSHECSRSSSPCKDIPDFFKGLIQLYHDDKRFTVCGIQDQPWNNFWKIRESESYMVCFYKVSTTMSKWLYDKIYQIASIQFWIAKSRPKSYQKSMQQIQSNFISHRYYSRRRFEKKSAYWWDEKV